MNCIRYSADLAILFLAALTFCEVPISQPNNAKP